MISKFFMCNYNLSFKISDNNNDEDNIKIYDERIVPLELEYQKLVSEELKEHYAAKSSVRIFFFNFNFVLYFLLKYLKKNSS